MIKTNVTVHAIQCALDTIRSDLQLHGGDVEFVDYKDGVVYVRLLGLCATCPLSVYTLKAGIEIQLKQSFSDIREVVAVE